LVSKYSNASHCVTMERQSPFFRTGAAVSQSFVFVNDDPVLSDASAFL